MKRRFGLITDKIVEAGLYFLIVSTPLAFGTVELWSIAIAEVVIFAISEHPLRSNAAERASARAFAAVDTEAETVTGVLSGAIGLQNTGSAAHAATACRSTLGLIGPCKGRAKRW